MSKAKSLPETFAGELDEISVLSAVADMVLIGRTSLEQCAGSKLCRRVLSELLAGRDTLDVHYGKFEVSVKVGRRKTQNFRKNQTAKQIDQTFDDALEEVTAKFGPPSGWRVKIAEIQALVLQRMRSLIGATLTFTKVKKKPSIPGGNPAHGNVRGGNTRLITCQVRRIDRINKAIEDGMLRGHKPTQTDHQ